METAIISNEFSDLYPFAPHHLTINGLRYHYLDEGSGEPLLMLHGNPTWSFYFRNLVLAFRERYRVIVPDHMGCGLSDKPDERRYDFRLRSRVDDLDALMTHLDPDRPVTLIVHDWGGMIGLAWAMRHLERIGRLVIMNTAGFFPPDAKAIPIRLRLIRTPNPIFNWAVLHLNLFAAAAICLAPRKRLAAPVRAGLLAPYRKPLHRLATLKFVQDIPLRPDDRSGGMVAEVDRHVDRIVDRPTQLIWGAHDFVFDRSYYDEWRRRAPNAEAHWLEEAGHYLLEDAPDRIIKLIQDFMDKHPIG